MSRVDDESMHHDFSTASQKPATLGAQRLAKRAYCSTVDAHTAAQVPQRLHHTWAAWQVVRTTPECRADRVEAARRALANGTLCLDPHVLAARLVQHSAAWKTGAFSSLPVK